MFPVEEVQEICDSASLQSLYSQHDREDPYENLKTTLIMNKMFI